MAVRRGADNRLGGDIAGRTRPIVDVELLTQTVREPLTHQARDYVYLAAGRKADDDPHRPRRIGLRASEA